MSRMIEMILLLVASISAMVIFVDPDPTSMAALLSTVCGMCSSADRFAKTIINKNNRCIVFIKKHTNFKLIKSILWHAKLLKINTNRYLQKFFYNFLCISAAPCLLNKRILFLCVLCLDFRLFFLRVPASSRLRVEL